MYTVCKIFRCGTLCTLMPLPIYSFHCTRLFYSTIFILRNLNLKRAQRLQGKNIISLNVLCNIITNWYFSFLQIWTPSVMVTQCFSRFYHFMCLLVFSNHNVNNKSLFASPDQWISEDNYFETSESSDFITI